MEIKRVAVIFDSVQRPETTGGYCLRALRDLVDVEHFQPGELDRVPRAGFDLYLNIDDGLRYHLPSDLRPSAWWAIDTHMDFAWCLEKSRGFDRVFAAQRDGTLALLRSGITSATWLPLACDPEIHGKHDVPKERDIAFVGHVFPGARADLLRQIRRAYPSSFIGQGLLIKSRTAVRLGQLPEARAALDEAISMRADDLQALRDRCQFLFDHGTPAEAESSLLALIERDPSDASAFHNLGTLMMRCQRHGDAVTAYYQALLLRPNYAQTHVNMGYALRDSGRNDEAVSAWEQALRVAPENSTARLELSRMGGLIGAGTN